MKNSAFSFKTLLSFLSLILVFSATPLQAQFGVNAGYQVNQIDGWILSTNNVETEITGNGISLGIDYWFRLKDKRIEFLPELNYSSFESISFENNEVIDEIGFQVDFLSFYFNTNIYLLDLLNDCNCPTFSKQNDFFKKGFFVQVSPGLSLPRFEYSNDNSTQTGDLQANIALGLGLDIGLTDIVTLTPLIRARYQPNVAWSATFPDPNDLNNPDVFPPTMTQPDANIWQYFAGLRIGIRLDNW